MAREPSPRANDQSLASRPDGVCARRVHNDLIGSGRIVGGDIKPKLLEIGKRCLRDLRRFGAHLFMSLPLSRSEFRFASGLNSLERLAIKRNRLARVEVF